MQPSEHHQYSPAGQLDQWGHLAHGVKHNRSGRRRAVRMLLGLLSVVALSVVVVHLLGLAGALT